jgi:tetratricopeptide (TPR) repeat protein
MIAKNEEKNIGECLKSIKGLADEIILTDTGSTDKTIEIAQSHGAKIEHFAWIKDFSAARNYSISKATSRWVIWLDADDKLPQKTVAELRKILSQETPNKVFSLVICNSADEGKTGTRFSQVRVFPNKGVIKFEGRIHEQIMLSIRKSGFSEVRLPLEIFHTGYENPADLKEKQLRNLEIFREQFPGEKGMNPLDMFHYGTSYEIIGDNENALKWLRESLKESKKQRYDELLVLLPHDIARILEKQGDLQGALESLNSSLKEDPRFEPAISRKARILSTLEQYEEAVKWFGYAASHIPKISFLPVDTITMHISSLQFLAEHWNKIGQTQVAIDILKTLKGMMLGTPHNPLALAEIYVSNDKATEALDNLEFLKKELGNKPDFMFLYAQAFALNGNIPEAIKIISKAKEKFPQDENIAELAKMMGI